METIFKYQPTPEELIELFSFDKETDMMSYGFSIIPLPISDYSKSTDEEKLLDLAKLFELRGESLLSKEIWKQIPDIERQYRGGFDYNIQ